MLATAACYPQLRLLCYELRFCFRVWATIIISLEKEKKNFRRVWFGTWAQVKQPSQAQLMRGGIPDPRVRSVLPTPTQLGHKPLGLVAWPPPAWADQTVHDNEIAKGGGGSGNREDGGEAWHRVGRRRPRQRGLQPRRWWRDSAAPRRSPCRMRPPLRWGLRWRRLHWIHLRIWYARDFRLPCALLPLSIIRGRMDIFCFVEFWLLGHIKDRKALFPL